MKTLAEIPLRDISIVLIYLFITAYLGWLGWPGGRRIRSSWR